MKLMQSKFASICPVCAQSIAKGAWIGWSRQTGACHANGKCSYLYPPYSPSEQVAPCWDCKAPDGRFRPHGAATPVYCDECHAKHQAAEKARKEQAQGPDWTDIAYEDACARQCGF